METAKTGGETEMGKTFQEITLVKACMTFAFLIKCHDMYDCVCASACM